MHIRTTQEVSCPQCAERGRVPVPDENAKLEVGHSVAAFGDQTAITCSNGHTYWVSVCQ